MREMSLRLISKDVFARLRLKNGLSMTLISMVLLEPSDMIGFYRDIKVR